MLRWILDLVLLLIIALCAWRGYRNGLIAGVLAVAAVLFSFYAADILADTYSGEFTRMLEPFVSGVVDSSYTAAEEKLEPLGRSESVYDMADEMMRGVGLMKSAEKNAAKSLNETVSETGYILRTAAVDQLCTTAAYVLTFLVMFILLIIAFGVIGNLFNLEFKLPGLELVNGLLGVLLGLAKGLMYAFAIAWVLRFTGLFISEEIVDKTFLLSKLMQGCPLVGFLGY